jgi:glycosyltransferase involved in cell wall biosynthesis
MTYAAGRSWDESPGSHRGGNLHVSPSPIVDASRIFKQTLSVARAGLFSSVVICGKAQAHLPRHQDLSYGRRIDRVGAIAHERKPSAVGKVLEQLSWSRTVFHHYSRTDIRVVNAHSVAVLPVCYLLSRKLQAKLIYDTHELETEVSTSTGIQRWIFKAIERTLIGRCHAVFVSSQSYADWYKRRYRGVRPTLVRNISDVDPSGKPIDLRTRLSVPTDQLLFIFTGRLTEGRSIPAILNAFAARSVSAHVLFLSSGGQFGSLVNDYCARHPNIHRLPAVPPAEVVHYAAGCDVGLCLIQANCLSYKFTLPNKAFEYAQAGLPFFFTDMPEIDRILGPRFSDWRVDDPARDLTEAVRTLTTSAVEEARIKMAQLQIPSWDGEAAAMIAVYSALVGQCPAVSHQRAS